MAVKFNDGELELLSGLLPVDQFDLTLSYEARVLYMLYLRPRMDYASGLVGVPAGPISIAGLMRRMVVRRPPKSKLGPFDPSSKQIRGYLAELVSAGLIERVPPCGRNDPLVFRCLLADTDLVCLREEGQMKGKGTRASVDNSKPLANKGSQALLNENNGHDGQAKKRDDGHISGISVTTTPSKNISNAREMSLGWEPSQWLLYELRESQPRFTEVFYRDALREFRAFWIENGVARCDWDSTFYDSVLNRVRIAEEREAKEFARQCAGLKVVAGKDYN